MSEQLQKVVTIVDPLHDLMREVHKMAAPRREDVLQEDDDFLYEFINDELLTEYEARFKDLFYIYEKEILDNDVNSLGDVLRSGGWESRTLRHLITEWLIREETQRLKDATPAGVDA